MVRQAEPLDSRKIKEEAKPYAKRRTPNRCESLSASAKVVKIRHQHRVTKSKEHTVVCSFGFEID